MFFGQKAKEHVQISKRVFGCTIKVTAIEWPLLTFPLEPTLRPLHRSYWTSALRPKESVTTVALVSERLHYIVCYVNGSRVTYENGHRTVREHISEQPRCLAHEPRITAGASLSATGAVLGQLLRLRRPAGAPRCRVLSVTAGLRSPSRAVSLQATLQLHVSRSGVLWAVVNLYC